MKDEHKSFRVSLEYPRNSVKDSIIVELVDVRAADDIRISYDFERDGWKIEQASMFSWPAGSDCDRDWQEVAFVQAWTREKLENNSENP